MINVTTDEGSYVGLMALDQRVLQNSNNKYDLTEDLVFTKLRNYDSLSIDSSPFPGLKAGLVTFSNAMTESGSGIGQEHSFLASGIDGQEKTGVFEKPTIELPRVRKLFSESWLYKDFERTSDTGLSFLETVPDTITSWAITGFSLNPKTGLTLTKHPTELKVFQKFFVSFDLPNLVKQGEMIEVPIYLANYMNKDALTDVKIERSSEDLEILKNPETILGSEEGISKLLPANGRDKIIIFIKPLKMGQFNITVKAFTSIASDAVQKTLNVKSEGIPKTISKTLLIHLPEEGIQNDEITFDIPENAIPASQKIEISVVGDIFRPLMRSLEKLARVPHGNGEDNMRVIVSNLLVLKYFQALNYTNPSLESKIRLHLELGYQNQLCFKHLDGSFGLFDRSVERSGDFWQTAFTLWGLHQVSSVIEIDSKVRERGLNYLKSKQLGNGCFKSNSGVFEDDVKFTAFGLIVFLMDNHSKTIYSEVVSKGLQYLSENSDNMELSSVSILSTYVLLLGRHEKAKECLQKLSRHSRLTSKRMLKTKPDTLESQIETTAENLINLFESQEHKRQTLLHIVRGLITFEEEVSPLTSLIALRAMILFVDDLHLNRKNLDIGFNDDVSSSGIFQVNFENSQVLQTQKLSENSRRIHFQSKGYGFAVVDVKYEYNLVPAENKFPSTYATNITTQSSAGALSVLEICVNVLGYISPDDLTIMEVNLQSGYIFDETNLEDIKNLAKAIELNDDREKVTIYFDKIDYNGICLKLGALEVYKVLDAKPGWVILYSTDRKDEQTTKSFYINK
ncbi:thioester-containing protein 1 allele R1-like [Episyrphus balteatus]|uniref:thioester-containing protein 1 allele R1-like n=1 Tax=Episyrphus balteatus TaxID=286459 RepID=UPI00248699A6|nr:thioester-containing protein 1 allele R1-like [Episyrphus balteatus]